MYFYLVGFSQHKLISLILFLHLSCTNAEIFNKWNILCTVLLGLLIKFQRYGIMLNVNINSLSAEIGCCRCVYFIEIKFTMNT